MGRVVFAEPLQADRGYLDAAFGGTGEHHREGGARIVYQVPDVSTPGEPQSYRPVWKPVVQECHDRRDEELGRVFGCGDQDFVVRRWSKGLNGVIVVLHDVAGPDGELFTVAGEGDPAALWDHEPRAQLPLEFANVPGHRGRRQVQCLGRPADTGECNDCGEATQRRDV